MIANDIDHLIAILDDIIADEKRQQSPLGYFPALYRRVTVEVRDKINSGYFEDGPRMEKLDVEFANRYLVAYEAYKKNKPLTRSWELAFEVADDKRPIVLQHLFLGMSAHINLDLGIVAAEVSPGDEIDDLEADFNRINDILGSMVNDVQRQIGKIWPLLKLIDWLSGKLDEAVADFSMDIARAGAWKVAKDLSKINHTATEKNSYIDQLDLRVNKFGNKLYKPGFILRCIIRLTRWTERGTVADRISTLEIG